MKKGIIPLIIILIWGVMPVYPVNLATAKTESGYDSVFNFNNKLTDYESNGVNQVQDLNEEELRVLEEKRLAEQEKLADQKDQLNKKVSNLGRSEKSESKKLDYVPGEILVKFKKNRINLEAQSGSEKAKQFSDAKNFEKKSEIKRSNIAVLKTKDEESIENMIKKLQSDPNVEYVQPNFKYQSLSINTNDTYRNELWGLDNTGQTINAVAGIPDADIDAPEAWAISEGSENEVILAVIDDGVAYNHPDLQANMWDGSNCVDENGTYLGGCNHGIDFEDDDLTPLPTNGSHGTHITGTIAAVKNNNKGIIGVAPNAKIMAIKFSLDSVTAVQSINFAQQNGAKIINASWGGNNFDQAMYDAIYNFSGLFITAAGNETNNNDGGTHLYPSDYDLDNIISVAAVDQNDSKATFSNYGTISVDVGAPGVNIYSAVAESTLLNETFENVITPNIPNSWSKSGYWGTYTLDNGSFWGNVLYGDLNYPYMNNSNGTVTSGYYDLSGSTGVFFDFWTKCDTEYTTNYWYDYMTLEFSADGVNFNEVMRWDEAVLDSLPGSWIGSISTIHHFNNLLMPEEYTTSNFRFRLRWVTDGTVNNYDGCLVDDIKITKYNDGSNEQYNYGYKQGTSMAAPHVAGLAALIWGYKSDLSYSGVKDTILNTGDSLPSLTNKTVTGKRINAYNALSSLSVINVGVDGLNTVDRTPSLEGTVSDDSATVTITLNGNDYSAVNNGDGTWTLPDNTVGELAIGIYDVQVKAELENGVIAYDDTTNELVVTDNGDSPPYAVAIDNYKDDIPVSGINQADNVYEFPVEGGITRFLAIYNPDNSSPSNTEVGPVRSARPYFARVGSEHKSVYAHAGGSAAALQNLANHEYNLYNLDALEEDGDAYFWRDGGSVAPYNLYTSLGFLDLFRDNHSLGGGSFANPWTFTGTPISLDAAGFPQEEIIVNYENINYRVKWVYNASDDLYYRHYYDNGDYQDYLDKDNDQVFTSNIAIQYANTNSLTELSEDQGDALLCREGNCINGTWEKSGVDDNVKFYINNGLDEFDFKTGKLWIHVTSYAASLLDTISPVITLIGESNIEIDQGESYIDAGATAFDNIDGDLTGSIVTVNPVNTSVADAYIVTYNVIDTAGNPADEITRTVNVIEPAIILGCTDSSADNYDPDATQDDGSCEYLGCTDSNADNYDPGATLNDGSCTYPNCGDGNLDIGEECDDGNNTSGDGCDEICQIEEYNYTVTDLHSVSCPMGSDYTGMNPLSMTDSININGSGFTNRDLNDVDPEMIYISRNDVLYQVNRSQRDFGGQIVYYGLQSWSDSLIVNDITEGWGRDFGPYIILRTYPGSNGAQSDCYQGTLTYDVVSPSLTLLTPLPSPTNDTTPEFTFHSDQPGAITYIGSCAGNLSEASVGNNNVTLNSLSDETYDDCSLTVTNFEGEVSDSMQFNTFTVDTQAPVITLLGDNPVSIELNTTYIDAGATALDNYDGDLTGTIITVNSVDIDTIGQYTITYNVTDSAGNLATEVTRMVNVVDDVPPALNNITIASDHTDPSYAITNDYVQIEFTASEKLGWLAVDFTSGGDPITSIESVGTNNISGNTWLASYIVHGNDTDGMVGFEIAYSDEAGNPGENASTTTDGSWVIVDKTEPVITLLGDSSVTINAGAGYADAGATAMDNIDGEITDNINVNNSVNSNTIGSYIVTYNVSDASGNPATEVIRTVNVVDTTDPVINILGDNPASIEVNHQYVDAGAIATDNYDGAITSEIVTVNNVNTGVMGSYQVTYNVVDSSGNSANETVRTVNVIPDQTPPVRSDGSPSGQLSAGTSQVTMRLVTDEDAVCRYSVQANTVFASSTNLFSETGSTTHSVLINGLSNGNSYNYYIRCQDASGNENISDYAISFSVAQSAPSGGGGGGGGGGSYSAPDTTPPSAPINFNTERVTGTINLTWDNPTVDYYKTILVRSLSPISNLIDGEDLKDKGETLYNGSLEYYEDGEIDDTTVYYYAISAYDRSSNYSNPVILKVGDSEDGPQATETEDNVESEEVEVLGIEYDPYENLTSLYGVSGDVVEIVSENEASTIYNWRQFVEMDEVNKAIFDRIINDYPELTEEQKYAIANFIQNGTPTTMSLGAGERAGALNSCVAAFGKFPETVEEWMDVIKVANGRWPTQSSEEAENRAKVEFRKIYLRDSDMNNPHDNAAVTVMAYGLRPANRNMDSEKTAIKTFKWIYGHNPLNAVDWDIVRAIAYSGAKR